MSRVLDAVARHVATRPDELALTGEQIALTWSQLAWEIEAAASWLATNLAETPAGAPVAVALDNGPAWVVLDLALMSLGRPSLPLPPFFTPEQRQHAAIDAGACLAVRPVLTPADVAETVAGSPVVAQPLGLPERPLHAGTAKVTYTSGSTGQPKGVCLSQAQMEAVATSLVEVIGREYAGVHLPLLPLGVLLENVAGLYPTLLAGGRYHALGLRTLGFAEGLRPDVDRIVEAVAANDATSLILTPELLRVLVARLSATGQRLPTLKLVAVGGAKVALQLLAAAREVGLPVHEGYGLSECASVVALNTPAADRPGAVGRLLPHLDLTVADDGELLIGPSPYLGYVGGPAFEGWLHTGDLGSIDADGFVRISGRKSNLLITAYGRNIAPEWVESELLAQPEIGQAVVFGEGAPELCAVLAPARPDLPPEAIAAAVDRANANLPPYARVGRFRPTGAFDRDRGELTGNGRPRRAVLHAAHRDFIELQS